MTTFDTEFLADAWLDLASEFGRTVSYTAYGQSAAEITAIWHPNQVMPGYYVDGTQEVEVGVLVASSADVTSPDSRDTVTIGSTDWAVKMINEAGAIVVMQLETRTQRAVGGGHHRIERSP